jgi:hypothetical protein
MKSNDVLGQVHGDWQCAVIGQATIRAGQNREDATCPSLVTSPSLVRNLPSSVCNLPSSVCNHIGFMRSPLIDTSKPSPYDFLTNDVPQGAECVTRSDGATFRP